jgi:hypothetical protein
MKPDYGISLYYPGSWTPGEQEMPGMFFFEAVESDTGVNFNVTVASDQGQPLSSWIAMITNELAADAGAQVLQSETIDLNGRECSLFMVLRNNGSYEVLTNNFIILHNGRAYMMNFTCPAGFYEEYQYAEAEIITSLVLW